MSQTPVRSGLPSGKRGICPGDKVMGAGLSRLASSQTPMGFFVTWGAAGSDCANVTAGSKQSAASAAAEIKYMWKWFFTGNPPRLGWTVFDALRVLLYHCEILALSALDIRSHFGLGTNRGRAAVRLA